MCIISIPLVLNDYNLIGELESYFRLSLTIITNDTYFSKAHEFEKLLKLNNMTLNSKNPIKISCSYASFASLFGIKLYLYQKDNKKFYSNKDKYDLVGYDYIDDILGLNNFPLCVPNVILDKDSFNKDINKILDKDVVKFTPLTLAELYGFPSFYGKGQTIALIALGGGYKANEISYYFKYLKLPTVPRIVNVYIDGATNNPDNTLNSLEVVMNIEISGAIANFATLVVYFAPNTSRGLYNAIYAAINDTTYKPNIISVSWGASEKLWPLETLTTLNNLFASAVAKGINIFCASGNKGSNNEDTEPNIIFPASSPNVIACGGTRVDSGGYNIRNETVWNNFPNNPNTKSATGGGISKIFSKLPYQNNVQTNTNMRCVPDLSANADPKTGYLIFINGGYGICGGTSCVSPLMAGLTARLNEAKKQNIGFINNKLYNNNVCAPIKSGNNGAYSANSDGSYSLTCGLGRIIAKTALKKF